MAKTLRTQREIDELKFEQACFDVAIKAQLRAEAQRDALLAAAEAAVEALSQYSDTSGPYYRTLPALAQLRAAVQAAKGGAE